MYCTVHVNWDDTNTKTIIICSIQGRPISHLQAYIFLRLELDLQQSISWDFPLMWEKYHNYCCSAFGTDLHHLMMNNASHWKSACDNKSLIYSQHLPKLVMAASGRAACLAVFVEEAASISLLQTQLHVHFLSSLQVLCSMALKPSSKTPLT